MEGWLTPVSISYKGSAQEQGKDLVEIRNSPDVTPNLALKNLKKAESPADALEILRNEPDYDTLIATLQYLANETSDVNITSPSAHASQLVHVLVSDIAPSYWSILQEPESAQMKGRSKRSSDLKLFLFCLRSVTGLNSIILSLKQAIQQSQQPKKSIGGGNVRDVLSRLLQVMSKLLEGDETIQLISKRIWHSSDTAQKQKALWNEFLSVAAGGRILGTCAQADDIVNDLSKDLHEKHWVSDGALYSKWLAKNITNWARNIQLDSDDVWKCCGELLSKSLRLGYNGKIANVDEETKLTQHR